MRGLIPLVGGVFLFAMFVYALKSYAAADWLTDADGKNVTIFGIGAVAVVGIVSLLLGFVLLAVQWAVAPAFFKGLTLPTRSFADLVLSGRRTASRAGSGCPDSTEFTVIAPDLSNLPPGATAIDPRTGAEVTRDLPDGHDGPTS